MKKKLVILIFVVLSLIYSFYQTSKIYQSKYKIDDTIVIGKVTNIDQKDTYVKFEIKARENIIAFYYLDKGETLPIEFHLNDKVKLTGTMKLPKKNTIPNTFNYQEYLYHQKIFYLFEISKIEMIQENKNIFYQMKTRIKNHIETYQSSYLKAFLLGDNDEIDETITKTYQDNGISHLFAISGMHISFLSAFLLSILKKVKMKEGLSYFIVSCLLFGYLFLVDSSPSVYRSIILYFLLTIKKIIKIEITTMDCLLLTFSILLFLNPFYLYHIGFLYSFTISFYLILMQEKLKTKNYLLSLIKVSFLSFLVSMPITIYQFYQVNLLSVIYNLFFVPFVSIILFPFSFIVLLFPFLDSIYFFFIHVLEEVSTFCSSIHILQFVFMKPSILVIAIYYILITLSMFHKKYFILFLLILMVHWSYPYFNKKSFVMMLDVGQGDAILLYSNHETMLIDTGNKVGSNDQNITTYLKSIGVSKLNYLVLTHGDMDHLGNTNYLTKNLKVDHILFNNNEFNDNELDIIKLNKKKSRRIKEKEMIYLNEFKIMNLNQSFLDENDSSIVLYVEIKNYKMMFMGDASIKTEEYILKNYQLPKIDILKVGHHGSKTSSSKNLIDKITPKYSFISVGLNNIYHHPSKSVLLTLENTRIYRTDEEGSVYVRIDKDKLKTENYAP